jgi:hypothetical protein
MRVAHARTVERALGGGECRAELGNEGRHRGAAGRAQAVCDLVGIDDGHAARVEQVGNRGLAQPVPPESPTENALTCGCSMRDRLKLMNLTPASPARTG